MATVTIIWDAVSGLNVSGYRVFRADTVYGPYSDISGLLVSTTAYEDTTVLGTTHYFYKVTCERNNGLRSSVIPYVIEGWYQTATPTPIPTGLTSSQGTDSDKIKLSWNAIVGTSPTYRIWKSSTLSGTYTQISGWISGLTYNDTSFIQTVHYFYKVEAKIGSTESDLSTAVEGWTKTSAGQRDIIHLRQGVKTELDKIILDLGEPAWVTDLKKLYVGTGTENLPIGNDVVLPTIDQLIVATGGQTAFTLSATPKDVTKVLLYINNLGPYIGSFSVSGTALTWIDSAPSGFDLETDDNIYAIYW